MHRQLSSISKTILILLLGWNMAAAQVVDDFHVEVRLAVDTEGDDIVVVQGLSQQQIAVLKSLPRQDFVKLWVVGVDQNIVPPLSGKIGFAGTHMFFKPVFPLRSGLEYQVETTIPLDPRINLSNRFAMPVVKVNPAVLKAVFPTARVVPENLLKFYLHFSSPMRKGDVYQFISLRERIQRDGQISYREIELPFLEIEQEFWSADSTRLTLLLDPGRIKRGLKPREEMGPIFEADREYELVIDGSWPDANGNSLDATSLPFGIRFRALQYKFKSTKADHTCPDPKKWRITTPPVDSVQPLELMFEEPLDSAMLQRVINVIDSEGRAVQGKVRVSGGETVWTFLPESAWILGDYEIRVDNRLEDLCGNSISKPFDVDVLENKPSGSDGITVLDFRVR